MRLPSPRLARDRMAAAREIVEEALRSEAAVYGLTTALAERKSVVLDAAARQGFSRFLIRGHLIAQGPLSAGPRRAGRDGLPGERFREGRGRCPPRTRRDDGRRPQPWSGPRPSGSLGSVGQADLGPMADLAEGLLRETGFVLADNEGLALVNNNAFATGWAALAELAAERLLGKPRSPPPSISRRSRATSAFSIRWSPRSGRTRARSRRSAASARCSPGAPSSSRVTPGTCRTRSPSGASPRSSAPPGTPSGTPAPPSRPSSTPPGCNPAVVLAERRIVSVGNLDIVPVAAALDFARIALATVVTCAAERTVKLLQSPLSGLPARPGGRAGYGRGGPRRVRWRRAGDRGGGTHARPPGLVRGREFEQGRRDRGPHDDGPALGEAPRPRWPTSPRGSSPSSSSSRPRPSTCAGLLALARGTGRAVRPRARACRLHRPRTGPARGAGAARRCGPGGPLRPDRSPGHDQRPDPAPRMIRPATGSRSRRRSTRGVLARGRGAEDRMQVHGRRVPAGRHRAPERLGHGPDVVRAKRHSRCPRSSPRDRGRPPRSPPSRTWCS